MNARRWLCALVALVLSGVSVALAYPPCGPYRPMDNPDGFCRPSLMNTEVMSIVSGIPFVWLRTEPSSNALPAYTVSASEDVRLTITDAGGVFDGYQWWWPVKLNSDSTIHGWVEEASLDFAPAPTPTVDASIAVQASWQTPLNVQAEAGVPYIFLRKSPGSSDVLTTLKPGVTFTLQSKPAAVFDGYQWWWPATYFDGKVVLAGWVEQGSVTPETVNSR